ncbi:Maf family protein [Vallicoccus soli]|uniref:Nucleoside triphosphate pyrophosphatase n=1 Tax=Vallicoccus soli TaxID=2339232 RepID=A0A3A3YX68_9ACTN|nr:nucleoside triphosphate pyrophosphatase [Vallicoccus soli]RJK95313.1 septum formation inhibitor Maf [Vallicoccus soli]
MPDPLAAAPAGAPPGPRPVPRLVLASASPARLASLRAAGVDPDVVVSGVDEDALGAPDPGSLALVLARAKARAVAERVPGALVLGCDSVLDLDGAALGKPYEPEEARRRWRAMRGREGVLRTGHCLLRDGVEHAAVSSTTVRFADVDEAEVEAYVATGEPLAVAGAFTLDGLGGWFVEGVDGDPHGVVGVSLPLLRRLLAAHGVRVADLWAAQPYARPDC